MHYNINIATQWRKQMAVNTKSDLQIGDMVTHTGKRGFWPVDKSHKGIGFVLSKLYKKSDRQYVHDVWFTTINQIQQIGARALIKINEDKTYGDVERERGTNFGKA